MQHRRPVGVAVAHTLDGDADGRLEGPVRRCGQRQVRDPDQAGERGGRAQDVGEAHEQHAQRAEQPVEQERRGGDGADGDDVRADEEEAGGQDGREADGLRVVHEVVERQARAQRRQPLEVGVQRGRLDDAEAARRHAVGADGGGPVERGEDLLGARGGGPALGGEPRGEHREDEPDADPVDGEDGGEGEGEAPVQGQQPDRRHHHGDQRHGHARHQRNGHVDLLDVLGHARRDVAAARGLEDVRVELERMLEHVLAQPGCDGDAELLGEPAREAQEDPGGQRGGDEPGRQPEHRAPRAGPARGDGVDDPAEQQRGGHGRGARGHVEDDGEVVQRDRSQGVVQAGVVDPVVDHQRLAERAAEQVNRVRLDQQAARDAHRPRLGGRRAVDQRRQRAGRHRAGGNDADDLAVRERERQPGDALGANAVELQGRVPARRPVPRRVALR